MEDDATEPVKRIREGFVAASELDGLIERLAALRPELQEAIDRSEVIDRELSEVLAGLARCHRERNGDPPAPPTTAA